MTAYADTLPSPAPAKPNPLAKSLSLDFQKMPLTEALNVYADFTGLNIIAASNLDDVIDVDLKAVSPDNFLNLLVQLYDLHVEQQGGVMMVMKRQDFETRHQSKQVKVIPVLYAAAGQLVKALNNRQTQGGNSGQSTLNSNSAGNNYIGIDERTNSVILEGTADFIERNTHIIQALDKKARQLSIAARLVSISSDDLKNLGVRLQAVLAEQSQAPAAARLFSDLSVLATSGYSLALGKLGQSLLDLEFQALKEQGKITIVSRPSLMTLNNNKALISQGLQIPFQIQDQNGSFHTEFKDAALTLEVTPRYVDGLIILDVFLSKDNPGQTVAAGTTIEKRQLRTTVQVKPGDTVVLGGIRENTDSKTDDSVPFFKDIPILDELFSSSQTAVNAKELVIFLTPTVVNAL